MSKQVMRRYSHRRRSTGKHPVHGKENYRWDGAAGQIKQLEEAGCDLVRL